MINLMTGLALQSSRNRILRDPDWLQRGREPQDAMILRYADTRLLDSLGLRNAVMSMRNTSKCACVIQLFFLNLCFNFKIKIFFYKFYDIVAWDVSQRWEVFINNYKECLIMTNKVVYKTSNIFNMKRKIFREKNLN